MAIFKFPTRLISEIAQSPGGDDMILAIETNKKKNLIISGCAGSGKTTVALLRTSRLRKKNEKENILFISYNRLLRKYLQNAASGFDYEIINGFYSWIFNNLNIEKSWEPEKKSEISESLKTYIKRNGKLDTIIIDEGQDFPDYIHKFLNTLASHITICADDSQILYPNKSSKADLIEEVYNARNIVLTKNFRNTKEIFNFSKFFAPDDQRIEHPDYEPLREDPESKPIIYKSKTAENQNKKIIDLINENKDSGNIGIAVPGKPEVEAIYKLLEDNNISACMHHKDKSFEEFISPLVTTYKSFKGLEFEIVILPGFHKSNYRDSPSYTFTDKDIYVACTRAREKLFILGYEELPPKINEIPPDLYILKNSN
jgi:DNA helicase IV